MRTSASVQLRGLGPSAALARMSPRPRGGHVCLAEVESEVPALRARVKRLEHDEILTGHRVSHCNMLYRGRDKPPRRLKHDEFYASHLGRIDVSQYAARLLHGSGSVPYRWI
jgi:hypothetical protein